MDKKLLDGLEDAFDILMQSKDKTKEKLPAEGIPTHNPTHKNTHANQDSSSITRDNPTHKNTHNYTHKNTHIFEQSKETSLEESKKRKTPATHTKSERRERRVQLLANDKVFEEFRDKLRKKEGIPVNEKFNRWMIEYNTENEDL